MALTQVIGRGLGTQTTLAGSNTLVLDTDGIMTRPLQPAFSARNNGTQSNIATGTDVTVALGTERFDNNGDFASNTFTSPVTGKYQLNVIMRLDTIDSAAYSYELKIATSNQNYAVPFDPDFGQDNNLYDMTIAVLADMDAGDTSTVEINQSTGTAQTDIVSVTFSGFLVC